MYLRKIFENESAICTLLEGKSISIAASHIFTRAMAGDMPNSQVRALLVLLAQKGETAAELFATWKAIRRAEKNILAESLPVLDTCGTGGDRSHSINLSTLSAFVMAAAGVQVIKHGNRAITSLCGSSDLLSAFGMNLNQKPEAVIRSAQKTGLGYFHAPSIHPVYARFQNMRRGIHNHTLFNLLGPVLNPAAVQYQILGVASAALIPLYAELLPKMGRKSALIMQGAHAMDEITTLGLSKGLKLTGKKAKKWTLNPQTHGFKKGNFSDLKIRSVAHAKKKAIEILKARKPGTALDSVILSAACGIWIAGETDSVSTGIAAAKEALRSGKAWNVLNQMVKFSLL